MAEDDIDAVFAINVKVPFVLVGELAPAMASRGKGALVNVGTMAAEFGIPGTSLYGGQQGRTRDRHSDHLSGFRRRQLRSRRDSRCRRRPHSGMTQPGP
jgi:NAD(P)-dependent dehydrogenase (short-subunit alcohol dehydrogenase family)